MLRHREEIFIELLNIAAKLTLNVMSRPQRFLGLALTAVVACAGRTTAPRVQAAPSTSRDLSRHEQALHALNRLSFGPRPGEVERVEAIGVDAWINAQLHPESIADTANERLLSSMETQRKQVYELLADHPDPQEIRNRLMQRRGVGSPGGAEFSSADSAYLRRAQQVAQQLTGQIQAAPLARAVGSERQLLEVMTAFWENHFSVFVGKTPNRYELVAYDRDVIRPRALGRFRDLLGAVAKSPEMLFYLDNWQSTVDSLHPNVDEQRIEARRQRMATDSVSRLMATLPRRRGRGVNENYARELMELHTLGVDGGYTQTDVQEVARALTGWTIEAPQWGGTFVFRPEQHDAGEKVVLGRVLAAGRGIEDGEEVLDIIARAPATAHHIAFKLAQHFVSDEPPPAVVDRCAQTFSRTDGDIRETLRCVVTSREFFSRDAFRAKVKTPFELVASTLRVLGAPPDTTPRAAQVVAQLGQPVFGRLTPDGWPDVGRAWMNSGAILNRVNFGLRVAGGQVPMVRLATWPAMSALRAQSTDAQVRGVIDGLFGGVVSDETRAALSAREQPLLMNAAGQSRPGRALTGLPALVGIALGTPDFQKR